MQKRALFYLLSTLLLFVTQISPAQTAVEAYGQLSVQGTQIVDQNGNPVQLRGMSLFWSQWQPDYYNYNTVQWLKDDWCINVIRIAMAASQGGYESNPQAELTKVRTVIDAAIDLGIYVIVDFHDHDAHNKTSMAQGFFNTISSEYGQYPNIIYEIYNEPLNVSWSNTIKPYAETVISSIRNNDNNNIVVVGTPNWSQDVDDASEDPINGANIAYTLHYYAATHGQSLRNKATTAINNGICLFVTEYGTCEANGNGFVDEAESNVWWDFLDGHNIGHCNWSIADKDEAASAITPGTSPNGNWSSNNITTSGNLVRNELLANCPDYGNITPPTPIDIPSTVQAEDYQTMFGVQTEPTEDAGGGENVGYIDDGDYLQFTLNATQAGTYDLTYRLAAQNAGGTFDVRIDNVYSHEIIVPETGDWQTWTDVPESVELTGGEHTFRISATSGGWNINYILFDLQPIPAIQIPGLIEASDYINMDGIQDEATSDTPPSANGDGLNIGYIDAGDFVEYYVEVATAATYDFNYRLASNLGSGSFDLYVDGIFNHSINVPETGGWQVWQSLTEQVTLSTGTHTLRLEATGAGWNLNYIDVQPQVVATNNVLEEPFPLFVYPNPSSGVVHISSSQALGNIELLDIRGHSILSTSVQDSSTELSLENLPGGTYLLKCGNKVSRLFLNNQ